MAVMEEDKVVIEGIPSSPLPQGKTLLDND